MADKAPTITLQEFISRTVKPKYRFNIRPRVYCVDGFNISIQAHGGAYCSPRMDGLEYYTEFELGYPSVADETIIHYAEDIEEPSDTVYPYVPIEVVENMLEKHGGILSITLV